MSTTGLNLITAALRKINVLAEGEAPSAAQSNDALSALNDMIDSWSNENLMIINSLREPFTLTIGQKSYTIGTGGNFNTARPMEISSALLQIDDTNPTMELGIEILNLDQYNAIPLKDTQSSLPRKLYYDNAYPLGNISLYPVPDTARSIVICSTKPLAEFSSLSGTVDLAPGFSRAIIYNLAIDLAPEYGKAVSQEVLGVAIQAKSSVKRRSTKILVMAQDPAVVRKGVAYNIYTGGVK